MIRLDSRTGSGELAHYFSPYGVKIKVCRLEFGDADWDGKGPTGKCAVVLERKRIDDLMQSIQQQRLSGHQLRGMSEQADYGYLVVEGSWRPGPDNELQVPRGDGKWVSRGMHTHAIINYVFGLALRAGLLPWRTYDAKETVSYIVAQYNMWQKPWAEHRAHDVVYAPANNGSGGNGRPGAGFRLSLRPREISQAETVALQLPGLSDRALWAARYFKRVPMMLGLSAEEWEDIKPRLVEQWAAMPWKTKQGAARKLGMVGARKIVEALDS